MKELKFDKKSNKYCINCVHGKLLEYSEEVFCVKKGFVDRFNKCLKYKYDPLKRNPKTSDKYTEFKEADFKL